MHHHVLTKIEFPRICLNFCLWSEKFEKWFAAAILFNSMCIWNQVEPATRAPSVKISLDNFIKQKLLFLMSDLCYFYCSLLQCAGILQHWILSSLKTFLFVVVLFFHGNTKKLGSTKNPKTNNIEYVLQSIWNLLM